MPLKSLQVRGPYKGPSGYEHHIREFARELYRQGVAVQLIDLPEWNDVKLPDHLRDPWFESLSQPVNARIVLHCMMPHQVVPVAGKVNANHTVFEATRICARWAEHSRTHDVVIVPTESSRRAWIDGEVPAERLRVCPYGINTSLYSPFVNRAPLRRDSLLLAEQHRVRFLNVSAMDPRKNLTGLVRAWIRATSRDDDAVMVIKLSHHSPDSLAAFQHQIASLHNELGKRPEEVAPVVIMGDPLSDLDMARLYSAFTHYLSMSFGEGWDQSMMEAGASGLRLIAPGHSAYLSYLDSSVANLIHSREVPAIRPDGRRVLFEGAHWWQADENHAIALIRSAIDGTDRVAGSARDRILAEFTWEKATQRLIAILGEFDDAAMHTRRCVTERSTQPLSI